LKCKYDASEHYKMYSQNYKFEKLSPNYWQYIMDVLTELVCIVK